MRLFVSIAAASLLSACATMTPDECRLADWKSLGLSDALAGQPSTQLQSRASACAKAGVAPDAAAYNAGRAEGLKTFCTPANGYRHGSQGGGVITDCPADLAMAFDGAYRTGAQVHQYTSRISSLESDINSLRSRWSDVESKLRANEIAIAASKTQDERTRHIAEAQSLRSDLRRIDDDIRFKERDIFSVRSDLLRVQAQTRQPGW